MKPLFTLVAIFTCLFLTAQNQILQNDSSVRFTDVVQLQTVVASKNITQAIATWVLQNEKSLQLQLLPVDENKNSTIIVKGIMPINDTTGLFNNVKCLFKLVITTDDNGYGVEWNDLFFEKNGKNYSVAQVYNSSKLQQPIQRVVYESKKNALARHNYILSCLQYKIAQVNASLKEQVMQHTEMQQTMAAK